MAGIEVSVQSSSANSVSFSRGRRECMNWRAVTALEQPGSALEPQVRSRRAHRRGGRVGEDLDGWSRRMAGDALGRRIDARR